MSQPLVVRPAAESERLTAVRLAFAHLDDRELASKWRTMQEMIARGEFDPNGIWLASDATGPAGAMIVAAMAGAGAVVWPPQVRTSMHDPSPVEDALVIATSQWLRHNQVRLAQTLLLPEEIRSGAPLLRNGYQRVTKLLYLRHFLDLSYAELAFAERLRYVDATAVDFELLQRLIDQTYAGSHDCPELNDRRSAGEFLAGHRASPDHDPSKWWLAYRGDEPAGVLLLNAVETDTWDIAYLGVVPAQRRHGVGRELVRKALFEAKANEMLTVTLALDERNDPARKLYHAAGFERFDEREVLLAVLD